MTTPPDLDDLVQTLKVIVCVGGGGVGKTTMSAANGLRAAALGKSACVVTIDPARRLAVAMGIPELGNTETRVADGRLEAAGIPPLRGQLWAMMLDTKRTWDDLVVRFALDEAQGRRILENHYYQQISRAIAGSQEYMAMEKLHELHAEGGYDLIVVDTPPTRHALDFLDAPRKMMGFMDESVLKAFLAPSLMAGKLGLGFLTSTSAWMFKMLERMTGFEVLRDLSDFVSSFSGMHAGFPRAREEGGDLPARAGSGLRARDQSESHDGRRSDVLLWKAQREPDALWRIHREPGPCRCAGRTRGERGLARAAEGSGAPPSAGRRRGQPGAGGADGREFRTSPGARRDGCCAAGEDRTGVRRAPFLAPSNAAFDLDVHDLSGLARVNRHLFTGNR